jgi:hypothetical protein
MGKGTGDLNATPLRLTLIVVASTDPTRIGTLSA